MGKFIVLVILVLGAGFYFPMTRPTLVDATGPIINPAFVWQTRGEMDKITRRLQMLNREGQALPDQGQDLFFQAEGCVPVARTVHSSNKENGPRISSLFRLTKRLLIQERRHNLGPDANIPGLDRALILQ